MEVGIKKKKSEIGSRKMEVESRKTLLAFRTCPIQSNPSAFSAAYLKFEMKF